MKLRAPEIDQRPSHGIAHQVGLIGGGIHAGNDPFTAQHPPKWVVWQGPTGHLGDLGVACRRIVQRSSMELLTVVEPKNTKGGIAKSRRPLEYHGENARKIGGRIVDDTKDLGDGRFTSRRFVVFLALYAQPVAQQPLDPARVGPN